MGTHIRQQGYLGANDVMWLDDFPDLQELQAKCLETIFWDKGTGLRGPKEFRRSKIDIANP